ncbi:MAG: acyl carrier protein [Traorella sp.]
MDYQSLCELIIDIISTPKTINHDSRLASDLGLCSLDMMLLFLRIEETTGLEIDMSKLKMDMTVDEILEIIV